jgi:DNA-directed RNA polymerase subunit RPC12/RpoP
LSIGGVNPALQTNLIIVGCRQVPAVVRFKCIYCGQRILARDDGVGKKGKCPKCKHELVVPKSTKGRPAISSDKEPMPERPKHHIPVWEKGPGLGREDAEGVLVDFYKESFGFLVPTYDKLSLFLMAVTLILLCVTNIKMLGQTRDLIHCFTTNPEYRRLFNTVLIYLAALLFLVLITPREKIDFKKRIMLGFAVLTNAGVGIIAGVYVIRNSGVINWLLVFPVWNIINGVLMLLMVSLRVIDEECISDREATVVQIILGLTAVLAIFILCNYVFKLYWAITLSICIVYTTSFDRALQNVFPGLKYGENEQAA